MKAEILKMLRQSDGYLSGQQLCDHFQVSRTAVWKAINQLKEEGYEIEAVRNKGYRIVDIPDRITADAIKSCLETKWMAKNLEYYDEIDSTNNRAKALGEAGGADGTLFVAETQTAGKGRRGRCWQSPAGSSISMSILLRPVMNPSDAPMLTLVMAYAATKALREKTELDIGIKWPNDLVVNGKKICGMLTEMSAQFDYINNIVIGIGINVHNESFPEEIEKTASSLLLECGHRFHRADIIEAFLEEFEAAYEVYLKTEDMEGLQQDYNELLVNMNRQVRVLDPKEPFEGKAMGITKKGELIVDTWESRKLVSSGEVSVRGIYGYV
ncbi:MAG: biotin--[acetyl-CoA-carboxylase] ligase [Clostridiales bacterium 41_12_two_minus]|nr:MAG: biotin--[acetyl-CoA-carboxylase] ligase [Clostridiales bacterium 41_12_two_minus]